MLIKTTSASFLIGSKSQKSGCVSIKGNSELELARYFGSLKIKKSTDVDFPFEVTACKQEYADALIAMVKEIDYSEFSPEFQIQE